MAQTKVTSPGIADDAVTVAKIPNTSITNAKLANSSITIDGASIALGGSVTTGTYPTFTSITPSTTTNESTSFVIVGTNFGATGIPTVEFQNLTGGITAATSVVRDSATQLTVVATLAVDGTYYIRIELNTGLSVRSSTAALTISDAPVWTTGSGTLGTIAGDFSGAVATVAATGDTVVYSEVSGTGLTGAGNANCSLNSSTGAITTTDFGGSSTSDTTYNFTIRATDAQTQTADRAFSLTSSFAYACDYLVIAGGASGGGSAYGGGGGAGGYRNSYNSETSGGGGSSETALQFTGSTVYTVTVGDGGSVTTGSQISGGVASSISGSDITDVSSVGGGTGAIYNTAGGLGGSGGGAGAWDGHGASEAGGAGTANQGYGGGVTGTGVDSGAYSGTGGGGGAGAVGADGSGTSAGSGGNGLASSITGASVTRAGGGGGEAQAGANPGDNGGTGGGGRGGYNSNSVSAVAGTVNTGSGGGGASASGNGGAGGSGVVILRMPTASYSGTSTGSPTITTDGSDTILVFNASGSYTG